MLHLYNWFLCDQRVYKMFLQWGSNRLIYEKHTFFPYFLSFFLSFFLQTNENRTNEDQSTTMGDDGHENNNLFQLFFL